MTGVQTCALPIFESHVQIGWERSESRTNLAFKEVVDSLGRLPAHGKVVITGVGKSGIVAKKMVATFNSLGELLSSLQEAS